MTMAGPGGREVGRVSIRVLPDTSSFAVSLEKYLQRVERTLRVELPVSLDQKTVKETEAELALLTRDRNINLDINTNTLERELGSVASTGERGFGRIAATIGAVSFAIAGLVAALPGFLAVAGGPVLAVAAGWEGIKNAASGLSDEMEHLRAVVSGVFENTMTPGFKSLEKLFPVLEGGLGQVALAVGRLFTGIAQQLSFPDAQAQIRDIFGNIAKFVTGLAPAFQSFVQAFLDLADAGSKAAAALTPQFAAAATIFANIIRDMANNGNLQKAMEGIGHAILGIVVVFAALVVDVIIIIGWFERLGEALGRVGDRIAFAWNGIPIVLRSVGSKISSIASSIATAFRRIGSKIAFAWNGIPLAFKSTLSFFQKLPGKVVGFFKGLPKQLGTLGTNAGTAFADGILGVLKDIVSKVQKAIDEIVAAFKAALNINSPSKVFMGIGSSVGEGFQIGMEKSFRAVTASATLVTDATVNAARASSFATPDSSPTPTGPIRVWVDNVNHFDARSERVANGVLADASAFAGVMGRMA